MSECVICGKPCEGTTGAVIDDEFKPMCHEGPDPTCYMEFCHRNSLNPSWPGRFLTL